MGLLLIALGLISNVAPTLLINLHINVIKLHMFLC